MQVQKIQAGATVFWEGDASHSLALLLSGQVRVFTVGESGRKLLCIVSVRAKVVS